MRVVRGRGRLTAEPFGYFPALDGLRAGALILILFHHARYSWAEGGFLALTSFFTLSGFLITSLVLREWVRDSTVGMRNFWVRRFRRLLPAAWTTMMLILVAGAVGLWNSDQLRSLRGDIPYALLQIVNWHFIILDRSYGTDYTAPSPMQHFWSLAVEEQFYLLLPVLVTVVFAIGAQKHPSRRKLRTLAGVFITMLLTSAVLNGVLAHRSVDRAYFGTDTRMAEILAGAVMAIVLLKRLRWTDKKVRVLADVVGLAAMAVAAVLFVVPSLRDESIYPWLFLLTAFITTVIIFAGLQGGIVTRILSVPPLPWLGKVSYGIYLIHWPVFVALSPVRTGLGQTPLFIVRVAVTLVLAVAMYYLIESPIRHRTLFPKRGFVAFGATSVVAIVAVLALVTNDIPAPSAIDQAFREPATTTTAPIPQLKVLIIGDQVADQLAELIGGRRDMVVTTESIPDCGLAVGGWIQMSEGQVERDVFRCRDSLDRWTDAITTQQPDFVLVAPTSRDALPRRFEADTQWAVAGDEQFTNHVSGMFLDALERLDSTAEPLGAQVVAMSMPPGDQPPPEPIPLRTPDEDPVKEKALKDFDRRLGEGLPQPADAAEQARRLAVTTAILADTAEVVGDRFIDLAAEADELAGVTVRLDAANGDGAAAIGPELGEWLEAELREIQEEPAVDAAPPLDINSVVVPEAPPPRPRRHVAPGQKPMIVVAGDSVAMSITFGLGRWSETSGARIQNATRLGCPIARGGTTKVQRDTKEYGENCDWSKEFADVVAAYRPNVVLLVSGVWEVTDRRLPGDNTYRHIGDPLIDRFILAEFLSAVDVLGSDGATVVLAIQPHIDSGRDQGFTDLPESDPARMDRLNEIFHEVAELRPGVVQLIDIRSWTADQPGGEMSPEVRPDGVHFSDASSQALATWLGPQLVRIAEGN